MASPPDPIAAIVSFLKADADVYGLTQGRVFGASLPEAQATNMPRACVIVQKAGGFGQASYQQIYRQRVDVRTYGRTPSEISELQLCCQRALNDLTRKGESGKAMLVSAIQETAPNQAVEPINRWQFEFSVWAILTSYTPVS
jgi:hypothetical protein